MERNVANYGFDAPPFIIGFLLGALVSALLAIFLPHELFGIPTFLLRLLLSLAALVMLVLGSMMLIYGLITKPHIRDFMLDQVQWRGNETVLDIGTGRGLLMIGAAKRLTTGKAIGIDIWSGKDLSGNTQQNALTNIKIEQVETRTELRNEDARKLQFSDQTFDVILSQFCLHNIEDKDDQAAACKEIARTLKPGGKAIIGDYIPTHTYAKLLADAGLVIESSRNYIAKAWSLTWIVIAHKPL